MVAQPAWSANVKVTPLGSHQGEFCRSDRALMFEDPDGTRILYDAGRTVRGPEDERLGEVDAVLLSHVHGDHLGDVIQSGADAGTCAEPDESVDVTPNSNSVNIVVAKNARSWSAARWPHFSRGRSRRRAATRRRSSSCASAACARSAASPWRVCRPCTATGSVRSSWTATSPSSWPAYLGPPGGYVLQFSNGLVAYLSGDTGLIAEQDAVVRRFFGAHLAVMNVGGIFSTGPREAAWVINELVQPKAVIVSHANEAATVDGKIQPGTRTATFIEAVNVPAHVPLSGRTMEFDRAATCVSGC